jgi:hypothetical protein
MPILNNIANAFLGATQVEKIYRGVELIWQNLDPDAAAYIAAVEFQDGQALEDGIKKAYDTFVRGLKADGIWLKVATSCILAGARTLNGALVPLRGVNVTGLNFVTADYDRKTGLKGNGTTKYIDTNYLDNAGIRIDNHACVYETEIGTAGDKAYIAARNAINSDTSLQVLRQGAPFNFLPINRNAFLPTTVNESAGAKFIGTARSVSPNYVWRYGASSGTTNLVANANTSGVNFRVFTRQGAALWQDNRMSWYSVGNSVDLLAYANRVTTLMADINAAI